MYIAILLYRHFDLANFFFFFFFFFFNIYYFNLNINHIKTLTRDINNNSK